MKLQKLLCRLEDAAAFSAGPIGSLGLYTKKFIDYGIETGLTLEGSIRNLLQYPPAVESYSWLRYSVYVAGECPPGTPKLFEQGRLLMSPSMWIPELVFQMGAGIAVGIVFAYYIHDKYHKKQE